MALLYNISTGLYHKAIRAAAPFHHKARQWVMGRHGLRARLEARRDELRGCLWVHCASVGEFEQALPVLELLKAEQPSLPVLITFFSPSGLEARKAHPIATHVDYLPQDSAGNARWLVELLQPQAAVFVRYEFWYHYLRTLHGHGVPLFLLSAIFRPQHPFFRWYGVTHRAMLGFFTHLFVQDTDSRDLLAGIGVTQVTVSGDTRFDRVAQIVDADEELPIAAGFRGDAPLLVCGSTWPADEELLLRAIAGLSSAPKCLVAPHELKEVQLLAIESRFPKPLVRWSELEGAPAGNITDVLGPERSGTLLLDRMGLLSRAYRYGTIAYVGGGFGEGIHSLLEPAAWGLPVIFGPQHHKFAEAQGLIEAGAGFEVRNAGELRTVLNRLLSGPEALIKASEAARLFVQDRTGAAARVTHLLREQL